MSRAYPAETGLPARTPPWLGSLALFLLALGVRIGVLSGWWDTPFFDVYMGDGAGYDAWARRILAGGWLADEIFYQAPLYPYALALLYAVFGTDPLGVRVAQALFGSFACVLLAAVGRRFFDARVGWLAGLGLALYPPAIFFDGLIQKASLGLLLLCAWLFALAPSNGRGPGPLRAGVAGVLLGALALTRENGLILVPILLAWLVLEGGGQETSPPARARLRARLPQVGAALCGLALALSPAVAHNWLAGGELVLTTAQVGPNFYIGNHGGANGSYLPLRVGAGDVRFERDDARKIAEVDLGRKLGASETSRYWLGRAFSFIRNRPGPWLGLLGTKLRLALHAEEVVDTHALGAYADHSLLARTLWRVLHLGVLLPLAAIGVWLCAGRLREIWLLHATALAWLVSLVAFYVVERYRLPLAPLLLLFSAVAVIEGPRAFREHGTRSRVAVGVVVAALALFSNLPRGETFDPRATAYYGLGLRLAELERPEALRTLERAAELEPRSGYPLLALGELARRRGDDRAAIEYLSRGFELEPQIRQVPNAIAAAQLRLGLTAEAIATFERALRAWPHDPILIRGLGRAREAHAGRAQAAPGASPPGVP